MKPSTKILLAAAGVLAILAVPVPTETLDDGGTRAYTALTYKIVRWNRDLGSHTHKATRVYGFPQNFLDAETLWEAERENVEYTLTLKVLEKHPAAILAEPMEGNLSSDKISFSCAHLPDIGVEQGSVIRVVYGGEMLLSYPPQIQVSHWELIS